MCIKLHFYLIILVIYFYATHKLGVFSLFYGFAILHEIAHIILALILGIKIKEIILLPVGVCAKYDYINNRIKEIIIAAGGPLFSIIVGLFSKNLIIREINLVIAFLNLIPIYPLDGGRILRATLEIILGYRKSILLSNNIAKILLIIFIIFGIVLAVYLKNFSLILLDVYIFFLIKEEFKKDRIRKIINSIVGVE